MHQKSKRRGVVCVAIALLFGTIIATSCTPEEQAAVVAAVQAQQASKRNHPFLACVRKHESSTAGGYSAQNPRSSASGAYQFLDSTWRTASKAAGHGGYSRAIHAPAEVQDAVAYHLAITSKGYSHWRDTGCGHGT